MRNLNCRTPLGVPIAASLGAVLLLAGLATMLHAGGSTRLTRDEMSRSRGGSQGNDYIYPPCDPLSEGTITCTGPGPCITCEVRNYSAVGNMPGSAIGNLGSVQSCGDLYNGTCVQSPYDPTFYDCFPNPGGSTNMPCFVPPQAPVHQINTGG